MLEHHDITIKATLNFVKSMELLGIILVSDYGHNHTPCFECDHLFSLPSLTEDETILS